MKRALVVGCNYPSTLSELRGCVNDTITVKQLLITYFGFNAEDITILNDVDFSAGDVTYPSGHNIKYVLVLSPVLLWL